MNEAALAGSRNLFSAASALDAGIPGCVETGAAFVDWAFVDAVWQPGRRAPAAPRAAPAGRFIAEKHRFIAVRHLSVSRSTGALRWRSRIPCSSLGAFGVATILETAG